MRIENTDEPSCFSVDFFTLQDAGNLTAFEPENTDFCSLPGETNLNVDLSEFDDEIIGDQDAADLEVAYFENEVLIENPSAYNLTDQTTTITAELSNSSFTDCSDEVTFEVFLNLTPEIQNVNDLENCTDFNLETTFDLTENTSEAIGNQAAAELEINYFTTFQDAENKGNQILDITDYTVNSASETIYVRLENSTSESCYAIDSFELISYPVEINSVSDITECIDLELENAVFDLTEIEQDLLGENQEFSSYAVSFFDEAGEEVFDFSDYMINDSQVVTARVTNTNNTECFVETDINLIVLEADNPQCDLSVNDENKVSIEVYPNPVSSTVFIESQFPITGVKVFDIKGKLVKQSTANNIKEINISEFSQGVYLMQVELENRQQTFKLIKE